MINLFGEEQGPDKGTMRVYKKWRAKHEYRKSSSFAKQCNNCEHRISFNCHNKRYHKCALQGVSQCEASDIRLSYVCDEHKSDAKTAADMRVIAAMAKW